MCIDMFAMPLLQQPSKWGPDEMQRLHSAIDEFGYAGVCQHYLRVATTTGPGLGCEIQIGLEEVGDGVDVATRDL